MNATMSVTMSVTIPRGDERRFSAGPSLARPGITAYLEPPI
jgi:hypothetical protein